MRTPKVYKVKDDEQEIIGKLIIIYPKVRVDTYRTHPLVPGKPSFNYSNSVPYDAV